MNYDQWAETYKPMTNHIDKESDTILYETYGEELNYIRAKASFRPAHVWTLVDGEDGTYIINGYHFVNRIAYIVTEEPFKGDFLEVLDSLYEEAK